MLLERLFRPRWKHRDAQVRGAALQQLEWDQANHRTILLTLLAEDPDAGVRIAALERIPDAMTLLDLAAQGPDGLAASSLDDEAQRERFLQAVWKRIFSLIAQQPASLAELMPFIADGLAQRHCWSGQLPDLATLLRAADLALLKSWLPVLGTNHPPLLETIAVADPRSNVRQLAASLVTDVSALEALARAVRSRDKAVFRSTRQRLQAIRQAEKQIAESESAVADLELAYAALRRKVEAAESDPATLRRHFPGYIQQLETLNARLARCPLHVLENGRKQAVVLSQNSCSAVFRRWSEHFAQERQAAEDQAAQQQEREGALAVLRETEARLRKIPAAPDAMEAGMLDAVLKTQSNRWAAALESTSAHPAEVRHPEQIEFEALFDRLTRLLAAQRRYLDHAETLHQTVSEGADASAHSDLKTMLETISWPSEFKHPALLESAADRIAVLRKEASDLSDSAVSPADSRVCATRTETETATNKAATIAEFDRLLARFEDVFARGRSKECQQILRRLADLEKDLPEQKSDTRHARMRQCQTQLGSLQDWEEFAVRPKFAGLIEDMLRLVERELPAEDRKREIQHLQSAWKALGGCQDRTLWTQFKAASDAAWEPCKAIFAAEQDKMQQNLQQREAIVAHLQQYLNAGDWSAPDWNLAEEVDARARKEWRAFYPVPRKSGQLVQKHFDELLAELGRRLDGARQDILEHKRALLAQSRDLLAEEDLQNAIRKTKSLQQEWHKLRVLPINADRRLWEAFRKACNAVFARLASERAARKEQENEQCTLAAELTDALSQLSASIGPQDESILTTYIARFDTLDQLGSSAGRLRSRFDAEVRRCRKQMAQNVSNRDKVYWKSLVRHVLQARFADESWLEEADAMRQAEFQPRPEHRNLLDEAKQNLATAETLRDAAAPRDSSVDAEDFLLLAELGAGLQSPPGAAARRMALMMEQLASGRGRGGDDFREQHVGNTLVKWLNHPGLPTGMQPAETLTRVNAIVDAGIC